MTVVARRFVAAPIRTAADVWSKIVDLIAPSSASDARKDLISISGIVSSLIASEVVKDAAIVVWGSGPRVRIYCLYGEDAVTGENSTESALSFCPTDGDWSMSLPCHENDLQWVQAALACRTRNVTARDLTEKPPDNDTSSASIAQGMIVVNKEAFLRQ